MSDVDTFEVPNFMLQKGGVLPTAKLAYATRGKLNAARDNAVLVPSWYTGTHADSETFMLGADRALDPNKYFIILTNLLGNSLSSSPSNSPAPVDRGRFPKVTIHDNVRLQHQLVTERLGIERLRLVTGFSMGACQTFQWAAQYPDMVQAACPIAGSARTGNYNKVFLLALRRTLELDPAFQDGFYDRPPVRGIQAFATIYAGWGTSEPFFREEAFRPLGSRSTVEHVADFWEPFFARCDANNLLSQLWTWEQGDISANPAHGGDLEAALGAIKARTIIVPIDNDRYFPPVDSQAEARHIPNAEVRVVASPWGHMALMNPGDRAAIDAPLRELLAG
ncbi:alpha/beta fold hydrolase [Geminicoccus harenae]|uniref:alpha/beta fold hydrolase n=1 Tax=Geminicoccus harenae TaxID=2498453 RepID=UPI00168B3AA9|nr:alpha/beta fold hydrolase [Geminicoccus harenae]